MSDTLTHTQTVTFVEPATVAEAIDLKAANPGATLWSGGTDLGVQLRRRQIEPTTIVSLRGIAELQRLELTDGVLHIGGGVTHRSVERSEFFAGAYIALQQACATIGSVQTRNVGTVGGNLANASPAADTPPVLLALGATVVLAGPQGQRRVDIEDFFLDYRRTALHDDEVIVAVELPVPPSGAGSAFEKLGRRGAMEISIACVGAFVALDDQGRCATAGVGLGALAPTPVRARAVEDRLRGQELTDGVLTAAAAAAVEVVQPIDDTRASADYRREVVAPFVRRALETARDRALAAS